jgi:1-acyl-sn-glycerol-3-phosphate acyltransferase
MRAFWRLLRVFWTVFSHTFALSRAVRRVPAAEQEAFRAARMHRGCQALCRILGIRVAVEGQPPAHDALLLVSNHFGVLDSLVLASCFPLAPVSKAEVAEWPFLGWVTHTMGVIFVERERRSQTATFVETVQEHLRAGVHVLVFPEGTTSGERRVQPFKTGAFEAVSDLAGGAVLPLHLDAVSVEGHPAEGAWRERVVWANASLSFVRHVWQLLSLQRVEMRVRVGSPIPTTGCDRKELAQRAHTAVSALGAEALAA